MVFGGSVVIGDSGITHFNTMGMGVGGSLIGIYLIEFRPRARMKPTEEAAAAQTEQPKYEGRGIWGTRDLTIIKVP